MKGILFNQSMVQAILEGRKTVTRRILKQQPSNSFDCIGHEFIHDGETGFYCSKCGYGISFPHSKYPVGTSFIRPPYKVGDVIYVRETWQLLPSGFDEIPPEMNYIYKATHKLSDECTRWRPSLFMP